MAGAFYPNFGGAALHYVEVLGVLGVPDNPMPSATGPARGVAARGAGQGVPMQDGQGDEIADALDRPRRAGCSAGPPCVG